MYQKLSIELFKKCVQKILQNVTHPLLVLKDLQHVNEHLQNPTEKFELGKDDLKLFQIPNKLYGRNEEINELKEAIKNSSKNSMCLVSGFSGMGKSKLVEELLKDQNLNLSMVYGKFDQFNRLTPYSAFIR